MLKKEDYLSTYDVALDILKKTKYLSESVGYVVDKVKSTVTDNTTTKYTPQFPAKGFYAVDITVDVPWKLKNTGFRFGQFTEIPPYFDFTNCYHIHSLFAYCQSLLKVDVTFPSTGGDFNSIFYGCGKLETAKVDLSGKYYGFSSCFMYCNSLKSVELLNTGNIKSFTWNFYLDENLETVNELDLHSVISSGQNWTGCTNLKNLGGFKGMRGSIGLSDSKLLTHESLMNVINKLGNALKPGETLMHIGPENIAKLTPAEIQIAIDKGWVVS